MTKRQRRGGERERYKNAGIQRTLQVNALHAIIPIIKNQESIDLSRVLAREQGFGEQRLCAHLEIPLSNWAYVSWIKD